MALLGPYRLLSIFVCQTYTAVCNPGFPVQEGESISRFGRIILVDRDSGAS